MREKEKIALVTGGARGIGLAITKRLGRIGKKVVIADKLDELAQKEAESLRQEGYNIIAVPIDVSSSFSVDEAVKRVTKKWGTINILVNNAGYSPKPNGIRTPTWEMSNEEWQEVININLTGVFYCTRAIVPLMQKQKWGRIINISSMAGRTHVPIAGSHYGAAKAGVIGFTRQLAGELASFGITVNAIAPGRIRTKMIELVTEEINKKALKDIPVGRMGQPLDIANAVAFFASKEASFITGTTLDIDGGRYMV